MLRSKLASFSKSSSSGAKPVDGGEGASIARKAVSFLLITVTGGVALSALDDLSIYYSCTRKALEKASSDEAIKNAIGEPIMKGPWYNASLSVAHKRHSVSCTFPVSGPRGNGMLQLKAIREGDDSWFSIFRHRDWEILVMDALLHVPENEGKQQTMRITVSGNSTPAACEPCPRQPPKTDDPEKKYT